MNSASKILGSMIELDVLTILPREGWFFAGVDSPESVSDHCYQTAILSYFISKSIDDPIDLPRILLMALFHDAAECRLTDLPRRATAYLLNSKLEAEIKIFADLFSDSQTDIIELFLEIEEAKTIEAKIVLVAHDLQNLIKALIYTDTNKGNMTEYLGDTRNFNDRGISVARDICNLVTQKMSNKLYIHS